MLSLIIWAINFQKKAQFLSTKFSLYFCNNPDRGFRLVFASPDQIFRLKSYLQEINIYALDEHVILKTIELRQKYRIKTPDAIIAAVAIVL